MFKTQPQFYWNLCFITFIKEVNVFGNVCVYLFLSKHDSLKIFELILIKLCRGLEWSHMLRWTVNNPL